VKICGLTRAEDARLAADAGADYLGVIASGGFSRSVDPGSVASIFDGIDRPRVAVTVNERPEDAARIADVVGASVLQLHGSEGRADVEAVRALGPWTVWKAIRARTVQDVSIAVDTLHDVVDGFLVEGWREGVVGGGGVRVELDGAPVRQVVPWDRTFVLAGGLTPDNVLDAVARFAPDVVDVSSGVERDVGTKDPALVVRFIAQAHGMIATPPDASDSDTP
jgi:phosphoribosylanthranilate isomerase